MKENLEAISTELMNRFPEFVAKMQPDDIQPFMLFGDFGIYIRDLIESKKYTTKALHEIFDFLNEMGQSESEEVQNLLTVGVLEILTDSAKAMEVANQQLYGEALKNLQAIKQYWNKD